MPKNILRGQETLFEKITESPAIKQVILATTLLVGSAAGWVGYSHIYKKSKVTETKVVNNLSDRDLLEDYANDNIEEDANVYFEYKDLPRFIHMMKTNPDGVISELNKYWRARYEDPNGLGRDLKRAYIESGTYIDALRSIFQKGGWDPDLAYLFIPESHWILDAHSTANGQGPYQFIPSTGFSRQIGLLHFGKPITKTTIKKLTHHKTIQNTHTISYAYDERKDPILAAQGVIEHFDNTKKRFNTNEIPIQLAGFNSNMPNVLNKLRIEQQLRIDKHGSLSIVASGQGQKIEKVNFALYMKYIAYLLETHVHSEKDFKSKKISQFISENLKYPSKLFSIIYLLKRDFFGKIQPSASLSLEAERIDIKTNNEATYTIKKGDTLSKIGDFFHVSIQALKNSNPNLSKKILKRGEKIKIPVSTKKITLDDIARAHGMTLSEFLVYNPAIYPDYAKTLDVSEMNKATFYFPKEKNKTTLSVPLAPHIQFQSKPISFYEDGRRESVNN